jgi:hypothetical protein
MKAALPLLAYLLLPSIVYASDRESNPVSKPVPGGWSSVAVDDARVKLAARQAVAAQASIDGTKLTLVEIEDAQRQVVAGINYKLKLSVTKGDRQQRANATVWGKLNGGYELTAWAWE